MDTLDNPFNVQDPESVPYVNTMVRYGLIGGAASIVFLLFGQLTGMTGGSSFWASILMSILGITLTVAIGRFAIAHHRDKELGGYIPFGRAFIVGLGALLIASVISTIFNYIYMTYIDPDAAERMIEGSVEMLENLGTPEEVIEQTIDEMRDKISGIPALKNNLIYGLIGSGVISLIVAALMKKEAPAQF